MAWSVKSDRGIFPRTAIFEPAPPRPELLEVQLREQGFAVVDARAAACPKACPADPDSGRLQIGADLGGHVAS